jgi:hypothetical protein
MRIQGFGGGGGNLAEIGNLVEPDIDGRIILRWIFRKLDVGGGTDWIEMAQDRDRWAGTCE